MSAEQIEEEKTLMGNKLTCGPEEIRAARLRAGLTQVEAAKWVGVTSRTWQRWEAGHSRIPKAVLMVLERLVESLDKRS
jgi:DNA-binding transcriptional regulator YiaG